MRKMLFTALFASFLFVGNVFAQEAPCNPDVEDCYDFGEVDEVDYFNNDPFYDDSWDSGYDEFSTWGYGRDFFSWNYESLFMYVFDGYCVSVDEYDSASQQYYEECYDPIGFKFGDSSFWSYNESRGHLISSNGFMKLYDVNSGWAFNYYHTFKRSQTSPNVFEGTVGIPIYPIYEDVDGYIHESSNPWDFMVFYVRVKFPANARLRAGEFEEIGVEWQNGNMFIRMSDPWYEYASQSVFALPMSFLGMTSDFNNPFRMFSLNEHVIEFDVQVGNRLAKAAPIAAIAKESFGKTTADANGRLVLSIKDAGFIQGEKTTYEVELRIQNANDGFGQNTFGQGDESCHMGTVEATSSTTRIDFHDIISKISNTKCLENGNLRNDKKYYAKLRVKRETPDYKNEFSAGSLQTGNVKWSTEGAAKEGPCSMMVGSSDTKAFALLFALVLGACLVIRRKA